MLHAWTDPIVTASATLGASASLVIGQVASDGLTADLITQGGIIAAGVSVFLYQERKMRSAADQASAARREADEQNRQRVADLEARIDRMLAAHAAEVQALNDRIFTLLNGDD